MANDLPAIANKVAFEAREFRGQGRRVSVGDDQDELAPRVAQRGVDAGVDVTVAGVARAGFHDLIFVVAADDDLGISVTGGVSRQNGSRAPRGCISALAKNGIAAGAV